MQTKIMCENNHVYNFVADIKILKKDNISFITLYHDFILHISQHLENCSQNLVL